MKMLTFSGRTAKEILRDPLTVGMGLGFPLIVLLLLTAIQKNVPVPLFVLDSLTPGVAVFGLAFISLFAALLISKDRSGSFIQRLYTTPLTAWDYILGYTLPLIPIGLMQTVICYIAAACLGLPVTVNILWAVLTEIPAILFFIGLGLLCGTVFNDKQVGGLCGALLTNLTAWLSGTWFDMALVGGWFQKIANALPFVHAVELQRAVLQGDFAGVFPHLPWVLGYMAGAIILAALVFMKKMRNN